MAGCKFCKDERNIERLTKFLGKEHIESNNMWFSSSSQLSAAVKRKRPRFCPECGKGLAKAAESTLKTKSTGGD